MDGNLIVLEGTEYGANKRYNNFAATTLTIEQLYVPGRIPTRYKGIIGRGTMVSVAKMDAVGDMFSEREDVLKLSFQFIPHSHDGDITRLRNAIPARSDHLLDSIICSTLMATDVMLSQGQIRDALTAYSRIYKVLDLSHRSIRVVVINRFKNIWEAKSVEEFKRIFVDCIECKSIHYLLYVAYLTYD